jgi:galactose oxidase
VTTADEAVAQARPFTFTVESAGVRGRWERAFPLPNVGIHGSVLPTGKVLMWGRRDRPDDSLDVHECTPFVWNPADGTTASTPQPQRADGTTVNLFCSSHCFLPDGRLLVAGGHQADNDGLSQACLYDAAANTWTPTAPMTTPAGEEVRRWYPTATTLADGMVLVLSGSFIDPSRPPGLQVVVADLLQIWAEGTWRTISKDDGTPLNFIGLPLYPRMHVAADGQVFMSGTNDRTLLVKTSTPGQWTEVAFRIMGNRDYCPAVMYDVGKVIYIGGGNDTDTHAPTAETEIIDLGANQPTWQKTGAMAFPRRQHNAVLLPDGTVLVLGGTRGGGGPNIGFNDLTSGQPIHIAELWNPDNGQWTSLTAESVDRCYHSTAMLLPDARVLSAGGGEYRPTAW